MTINQLPHSSMAARVRETLDGVREGFEVDAPIRFDPAIYHASEATLLSLVRAPSVVWGVAVAVVFGCLLLPRPPLPAVPA